MGIITFNNGKVTSVMKQWSNHFDNSEVKLTFQSIYDVINGITKNNTVPAKVSTKQANSPDRNQEIITIKMGHRRVAIMSNEEIRFKTKTVEVFEYLE